MNYNNGQMKNVNKCDVLSFQKSLGICYKNSSKWNISYFSFSSSSTQNKFQNYFFEDNIYILRHMYEIIPNSHVMLD